MVSKRKRPADIVDDSEQLYAHKRQRGPPSSLFEAVCIPRDQVSHHNETVFHLSLAAISDADIDVPIRQHRVAAFNALFERELLQSSAKSELQKTSLAFQVTTEELHDQIQTVAAQKDERIAEIEAAALKVVAEKDAKVDVLEQHVRRCEEESHQCQQELSTSKEHITSLTSELEQAQQVVNNFQGQSQQLLHELEEEHAMRKRVEAERDSAMQQVHTLSSSPATRDASEVFEHNDQIDILAAQLAQAQSANESLQAALSAADESYAQQMQIERDHLSEELTVAQQKLHEEVAMEIGRLRGDAAMARKQCDDAEKHFLMLEEDNKGLRAQLEAQADSANEAYRATIFSSNAKQDSGDLDEGKDLRSANSRLAQQLAVLRTQLEQAKQATLTKEKENTMFRSQLETYRAAWQSQPSGLSNTGSSKALHTEDKLSVASSAESVGNTSRTEGSSAKTPLRTNRGSSQKFDIGRVQGSKVVKLGVRVPQSTASRGKQRSSGPEKQRRSYYATESVQTELENLLSEAGSMRISDPKYNEVADKIDHLRRIAEREKIMDKAQSDFHSGQYDDLPFDTWLYNSDKSLWLLFVRSHTGAQPVRAMLHPAQFDPHDDKRHVLPWPTSSRKPMKKDGANKSTFAMTCLIAQIPEVQVEAAKTFLSHKEFAAFHRRTYGDDIPRSPISWKEKCINGWEATVRTLSGHERFRTAARWWAAGEEAISQQRCWPPSFVKPKVDESCTKYANAEEQEAASEYSAGVRQSTVDELATKTDNVSLDWNWGAELDKMITATGSLAASW